MIWKLWIHINLLKSQRYITKPQEAVMVIYVIISAEDLWTAISYSTSTLMKFLIFFQSPFLPRTANCARRLFQVNYLLSEAHSQAGYSLSLYFWVPLTTPMCWTKYWVWKYKIKSNNFHFAHWSIRENKM